MLITKCDTSNSVYLTGEIDQCGFADFCKAMDELATKNKDKAKKPPINLVLNTYGGSVTTGLSIIDKIRRMPTDYPGQYVDTQATGVVASMGFVILISGHGLRVSKRALIHFHHISYGCYGASQDHVDRMKSNKILRKYVKDILLEMTMWDEAFIDDIEEGRREIYMDVDEFITIYRPTVERKAKEEAEAKAKKEETKAKRAEAKAKKAKQEESTNEKVEEPKVEKKPKAKKPTKTE